jgi:uncharacterized membrane protein
VFALIQETAAYGSEQALAFLGRLHPLLLHLPIGLFAASALFELLGWFKPSLRPARRWTNVTLALCAAVAAGSGYLLGGESGYQGELVDDHRMFGILVGVFAGLLALSELRAARAWTIARLTCFSLCAATLYLAGHHGTGRRSFRSTRQTGWPVWSDPTTRKRRPPKSDWRTKRGSPRRRRPWTPARPRSWRRSPRAASSATGPTR